MAKNTIKLKKYVDIINEFVAAGTITPGHLLVLGSGGTVAVHNTAGGNHTNFIALENELHGDGINVDYASGDPVQVWVGCRGEVAYMLLNDGENAAIGVALESAGNGRLRVHIPTVDSATDVETFYGNQIVGIALDAVDMSGSSGVDTSGRIKVMFV